MHILQISLYFLRISIYHSQKSIHFISCPLLIARWAVTNIFLKLKGSYIERKTIETDSTVFLQTVVSVDARDTDT